MIYGYSRCSTHEQSLDLQLDALKKAGCTKIFKDVQSGMSESRKELNEMLEVLRPGDKVIVWRIDRLGRSLKHLIEVISFFRQRSIEFNSITEHIDSSTPVGRFTLNLYCSLAEMERDVLVQRTKAGMQAIKARGKHIGRPWKISPSEQQSLDLSKDFKDQDESLRHKISKRTYNRYKRSGRSR